MSFKLGLVGLCTSHPGAWVPIIRDLVQEGVVDVEQILDNGELLPGYVPAKRLAKALDGTS